MPQHTFSNAYNLLKSSRWNFWWIWSSRGEFPLLVVEDLSALETSWHLSNLFRCSNLPGFTFTVGMGRGIEKALYWYIAAKHYLYSLIIFCLVLSSCVIWFSDICSSIFSSSLILYVDIFYQIYFSIFFNQFKRQLHSK